MTLTNNSSGAIVVGGQIDVSGGSTSGNGGTITISQSRSQWQQWRYVFRRWCDFKCWESLIMEWTGNGGSITVNAAGGTPGVIDLPGTYVSGVFFGAYGGGNGGTITITAAGFTGLSSQQLYLSVPAAAAMVAVLVMVERLM